MNKTQIKRIGARVCMVLIFLALLFVVSSQSDTGKLDLGWYKVADWEISVCSGWGGITKESEEDASSGETSGKRMSQYSALDLSAALQAGILEVEPGEVELPSGTMIYEVSWYFQPVYESINYEVLVYYADGTSVTIEDTSATPSTGYTGYWANETNLTFTHAILKSDDKNIEIQANFTE